MQRKELGGKIHWVQKDLEEIQEALHYRDGPKPNLDLQKPIGSGVGMESLGEMTLANTIAGIS